ncbi:MAG: T9SS type B sorting domain-containing protein [Cyclobacteriaceae bacterium]
MLTVRKIYIINAILILSGWQSLLFGQVSSQLGRFEAEYNQGCDPFKIILTETDTFPDETVIQYDFTNNGIFEGFEDGEEISYIYDTPGNYTIIQLTGIDEPGFSKTDTMEVIVRESVNPDYSIFTCENNGAKIEILPDAYDQHKIYFTPSDSVIVNSGEPVPAFIYPPGTHSVTVKGLFDGAKENCASVTKAFTTINNLIPADLDQVALLNKNNITGSVELQYDLQPDIIYDLQTAIDFPAGFQSMEFLDNSSSSLIIDSLDTENNINIFRIAAFDACQNTNLYSDTISTISIDVRAENGQNRVEWNSFPLSFSDYQLFRNNQSFQNFTNVNLKVFVDSNVECFTNYCYSIQYTNSNGGISLSDTICVESFIIYFPPSIKNTTASVDGVNIDLNWDDPENATITSYFIQREIEDDVFATIDSTLVNQYTDTGLDTDTRGFCYRINYLDECRNRSNLGDLTCTIFLTIENNQLIEWNRYTGWQNGVKEYVVEVYNENGIFEKEINVGLNRWYEDTTFLSRQIIQYRIRAESNDDPALITHSNFVIQQVESVLWLPNSFTPNGDGLNDFFKPEGTQMREFSMRIFTRYGDLIYTTEDQNLGWDGTYNGEDMPPVTYIYKMEATDELDKKYNKTGQLLLIRH